MRIPERDVTYIVLSVYVLTLTSPIRHKIDHAQVNLIQLKTLLELDFTEYIPYTDVWIADLCWQLMLGHLFTMYRVTSVNLTLTCSPNNELHSSTCFSQFKKLVGVLISSAIPKQKYSALGLSSCSWQNVR